MVSTVQKSGSVWRIPLEINGTVVTFKVDTGAQVSILPCSEYRRLRQNSKLCPSQAKLLPYGSKSPLPVDGQCVCYVTLENGISCYLRFPVVPFHDPILGLGECEHLGLINSVAQISTAEEGDLALEGQSTPVSEVLPHVRNDPVAGQFLDMFGGIRCLHNHRSSITLHEEARPYAIASPRRVPFPLYDRIKMNWLEWWN
jgi:hypothetical protein